MLRRPEATSRFTWFTLCVLLIGSASADPAQAQQPAERGQDVGQTFLPTAGMLKDPSRQLKCAVLKWARELEKPVLTLICPPEIIYSPLRIVFSLSWNEREEIPGSAADLPFAPGDLLPLRLNNKEIEVLVPAKWRSKYKAEKGWLRFTAVVQVGLLTEP